MQRFIDKYREVTTFRCEGGVGRNGRRGQLQDARTRLFHGVARLATNCHSFAMALWRSTKGASSGAAEDGNAALEASGAAMGSIDTPSASAVLPGTASFAMADEVRRLAPLPASHCEVILLRADLRHEADVR